MRVRGRGRPQVLENPFRRMESNSMKTDRSTILSRFHGKVKQEIAGRWTDFYGRHLALSAANWDTFMRIHPVVRWWMKNLSLPVVGPAMRRLSKIDGEGNFSQAHILPINRNLDYQGKNQSVVIPINLIRQAIEQSSYRVIKHKCFCRDGCGCTDYPVDLGCIMLGEGCRSMVARGTARPATVDEALNHLERAAGLGLVCLTMWIGMEMMVLGIPEKDHDRIVEVCFCCPCCCQGLRFFKNYDPRFMSRFRSIGWRPEIAAACTSCGNCAEICPMRAIEGSANGFKVSDKCIGCGLCAFRCPQQAIVMQEVVPQKKDILDYFWGFRPTVNS